MAESNLCWVTHNGYGCTWVEPAWASGQGGWDGEGTVGPNEASVSVTSKGIVPPVLAYSPGHLHSLEKGLVHFLAFPPRPSLQAPADGSRAHSLQCCGSSSSICQAGHKCSPANTEQSPLQKHIDFIQGRWIHTLYNCIHQFIWGGNVI